MKDLSKLIKYGFFGATTASLELVTFLLLNEFVHIYIASTVSFFVALIVSFLFNKFIVFKNSKNVTKAEVVQFVTLGLVNSQLSSLMTWGVSFVLPSPVAKIISMGAIAAWNYVLMNFVIFKRKGN